MSDYYNHTGYPVQGAAGLSVDARTEFDSIATAFTKIAGYTGFGGRIVRINAGGTAQEAVTLATATIESYADAQAGTHTLLGTVAGTNTITATATPTLTAYATGQILKMPAAGSNTGATTLAIDGLAARNIVRPDGQSLSANDILGANYECLLYVRAADIVLMNPYTGGAAKTTPVGADAFSIFDSAAGLLKTLSLTNLFAVFGSLISATTAKTTPVAADTLLLADSAAGNANKSFSIGNLVTYLVSALVPNNATNATNAATANDLIGTPAFFAPITNSLTSNVALNNQSLYFDGPSIAQGSAGKWFVSGTVTCVDALNAEQYAAKLWDGTTLIASTTIFGTANGYVGISLSGFISAPAGNLRISVRAAGNTTGNIVGSASGKESTIIAHRIG